MRRGKVDDGPCRSESDLPRPTPPSLAAARMSHTVGFRLLVASNLNACPSAKTPIIFGLHWVGFEFSCCDDVSTFDFDFVPVAAVADFLATSQIIMNRIMMRWAAMPHSGGRE